MVYTVTLNPSLDYTVKLDKLIYGRVNRSMEEVVFPGGKGINVSMVLKHLGIPSVILGFIAGFTGREIQERLEQQGCQTDFVNLKQGMSRINVKLHSQEETEINGSGPVVSSDMFQKLADKLNVLTENDILVLAGSIPSSLPYDIYELLIKKLEKKHVRVVVDTTGELLLRVLPYHPYLIKPNHHELGELFQTEVKSKEEALLQGQKLIQMGAQNVIISMAEAGAVYLNKDGGVSFAVAPKGIAVNCVGAGDATVAGFLAGIIEGDNSVQAFRLAVASGSASAFNMGFPTKKEVLRCMEAVRLSDEIDKGV